MQLSFFAITFNDSNRAIGVFWRVVYITWISLFLPCYPGFENQPYAVKIQLHRVK